MGWAGAAAAAAGDGMDQVLRQVGGEFEYIIMHHV
jgi:hypothetical protein